MARSLVSNMIERVRRQLSSTHRGEVYTLGNTLDTDDTILTVAPTPDAGLRNGSEISVGLETMRVTDVDRSDLTVIRGWMDSNPVTHTIGATVWANARFSTLDIYETMIDEIRSWGPHLYRVVGFEVGVTDYDDVVHLGADYADAYGVISVVRQWAADALDYSAWPAVEGFRVQRGTTDWVSGPAASGMQIRLPGGTAAGTLFTLVAMPFDIDDDTLSLDTDLVEDVGLAASMLDLLAMGIKLRLLADDEAARGGRDVQGEPRRAAEVPYGGGVQMQAQGWALYTRRKQEEINKLRTRYPYRAG